MLFQPVCYEHAARLAGCRPYEVSRHPELMSEAHLKAMKEYSLSKCTVGIDIYNVEIESYGCRINDPMDNGLPSAGPPVIDSIEQLRELRNPGFDRGRIRTTLEAAEQIRRVRPDAEVRVPVSGPFTQACHLYGMENMICALMTEPEESGEALMRLAVNDTSYIGAALDAGFGITLFESSVTPPLLSPRLFEELAAPALKRMIDFEKAAGGPGTELIIGGDTVHILGTIRSLAPSGIICPVETDQKKFMEQIRTVSELSVRVNMSPSVFLPGKEMEARAEARRVLEIVTGRKNCSVGSLIPFDADPEIIREVSRFFQEAR